MSIVESQLNFLTNSNFKIIFNNVQNEKDDALFENAEIICITEFHDSIHRRIHNAALEQILREGDAVLLEEHSSSNLDQDTMVAFLSEEAKSKVTFYPWDIETKEAKELVASTKAAIDRIGKEMEETHQELPNLLNKAKENPDNAELMTQIVEIKNKLEGLLLEATQEQEKLVNENPAKIVKIINDTIHQRMQAKQEAIASALENHKRVIVLEGSAHYDKTKPSFTQAIEEFEAYLSTKKAIVILTENIIVATPFTFDSGDNQSPLDNRE